MSSDGDDLAAILNLPPVKVTTELKKETDMMVVTSDEEDIMLNRYEVADTITEIDMTQNAKVETEEHGKVSVELDKIVIKRLIDKGKPDQGELHETITVGTTVICRTCFAKEIEGEVLAFNAHTRMVVIKPISISGQHLRSGMHMVNLDFVKDIRIMRMCTNKPPERTNFEIERLNTSMEEGVEREKLVLPMEARNTTKDMLLEEEHWSQNDADAPGELFGTTNTVNIDSVRGKRQQTHNRMTTMNTSTHRGDVQYEPYQEQNHGSVACQTTKTMNEGDPQQTIRHEREHPQGGHEGQDLPGGGELR